MIRRLFAAYKRRRQKRSRLYRFFDRTLTALGIAYALLVFFPYPLFAHSVHVGQFDIYSDRPISPQIKNVINSATARLKTSSLYSSDDSFAIYIAHDNWRRRLMNPRSSGAFGASIIITGNTVLNRSDIPLDLCYHNHGNFNQRSLHSVIAHECTHHMLAAKLGIIAYLQLPEWKNEGYCEYIAGGSTFPVDRGLQLLREGKQHSSHAFRYLTYWLAVRQHMDRDGMNVSKLIASDAEFTTLLHSAVTQFDPDR